MKGEEDAAAVAAVAGNKPIENNDRQQEEIRKAVLRPIMAVSEPQAQQHEDYNYEETDSVVSSIATMSLTPPQEQLHHHPISSISSSSFGGTGGGLLTTTTMKRTTSRPSFANLHNSSSMGGGLVGGMGGLVVPHVLETAAANEPAAAPGNGQAESSFLEQPPPQQPSSEERYGYNDCAAAAAGDDEPVLDAAMLQTLEESQLARLNETAPDLLEDENAIMLESSSSHEEEEGEDHHHHHHLASGNNHASSSTDGMSGGIRKTTSFLPVWDQKEEDHSMMMANMTIRIHPLNNNNNNNNMQHRSSSSSLQDLLLQERQNNVKMANDDDDNAGDDDDAGDVFLRTNSLLNLHHGRHPSTIAEEMIPTTTVVSSTDPHHHAFLMSSQQQQEQQKSGISSSTIVRDDEQPHEDHPLLRRSSAKHQQHNNNNTEKANPLLFQPHYPAVRFLDYVSRHNFLLSHHTGADGAATWIAFWGLLAITCANYVLTPIRDAIALTQVEIMPQLTLCCTVLALISSVPIGWLFEAPDPNRRRLWKRMGLTRGETQGTSLALLYRLFGLVLLLYAVAFELLEPAAAAASSSPPAAESHRLWWGVLDMVQFKASVASAIYIAFFLIVHLMKLHCLSLVWGVTTEAMEYEEVARKQYERQQHHNNNGITSSAHHPTAAGSREEPPPKESSSKMRLKRLSLVGFGGTMGGILGSLLVSSMSRILRLSGLLVFASVLLEISAELSVELGRIMQKHWVGQQHLFQSTNDLAALDPSMVRSSSLGSMKRISSGNSLNRIKSASELSHNNSHHKGSMSTSKSTGNLFAGGGNATAAHAAVAPTPAAASDDTFMQRMLRGVTTILRSRLLMSIFTYNALYASTNVLLSFQRAHLVAKRDSGHDVQGDTAFLANINMASSFATFALQATGTGVFVANYFGLRGTLALMPVVRFLGVASLAWWHRFSGGRPPNLFIFLIVDEFCKVMNMAVAKPVRESLWRGLSNEARYEAKPLSDTLSNRWGGGSAAFLVSSVDKMLDLMRIDKDISGVRNICGLTPTLFLCLVISAWWAAVSADLGQIRRNIDLELKKRQ